MTGPISRIIQWEGQAQRDFHQKPGHHKFPFVNLDVSSFLNPKFIYKGKKLTRKNSDKNNFKSCHLILSQPPLFSLAVSQMLPEHFILKTAVHIALFYKAKARGQEIPVCGRARAGSTESSRVLLVVSIMFLIKASSMACQPHAQKITSQAATSATREAKARGL